MATWLWPGPRFWTLKPATFEARASMPSTPRERSTSSVGAATEKGVFCTVSSRFMAVTVISSSSFASRAKSAFRVAPASSLSSFRVCLPKPLSETVTEYTPGGRLTV
jgi:hypothetical protein